MPGTQRLQRLASQLRQRAQPPLDARLVPLTYGSTRIGLASPAIAEFLLAAGIVADGASGGVSFGNGTDPAAATLTANLHSAALALRDAGLIAGWRDEALDVRPGERSETLATIERAACRALGIATTAVHLNAYRDDDTLLVAQRAQHKPIDPGLWDNLVGGMVPAGESLLDALRREAWEEAGLTLQEAAVQRGRWFEVRRPVPEGLQSEIIHVFDATVPPSAQLANQDGEVAAIEARPIADVVDAIERGEFTLEAALATLESLTRRGSIATPSGLFHSA
jgi:8-oxo-dGTP pyrophosphatase MutT (NUDIX family)